MASSRQNIVQLASGTPELSTLVTALKAGDLVQTLSGKGPFTVFAPTNNAFSKLPNDTLNYLLEPRNKVQLQNILTYHVAPGSVYSSQLSNDEKIKTVEGQTVEVHLSHHQVYINQARVVKPDVSTSNGVVHLIDEVLLPHSSRLLTSEPTIVDLAVSTPDLSTLVTALKAGDLVETLSGKGPFTVFAPTNEAFDSLPKHQLEYLLQPCHQQQLVDILTYHVVSGKALASSLKNGQHLKTVEGKTLDVHLFDNKVFINDAEVVKPNVDASNGVVHVINKVLNPHFHV